MACGREERSRVGVFGPRSVRQKSWRGPTFFFDGVAARTAQIRRGPTSEVAYVRRAEIFALPAHPHCASSAIHYAPA
jgi:hypothetical protein